MQTWWPLWLRQCHCPVVPAAVAPTWAWARVQVPAWVGVVVVVVVVVACCKPAWRLLGGAGTPQSWRW